MSNRIHYSSKKEFVLGLLKPKDESLLVCGAGGSRTLVQTGNPKAFYMLIRHFILLSVPGIRQPNTKPSP